MTFLVKERKHRRVIFTKRRPVSQMPPSPSDTFNRILYGDQHTPGLIAQPPSPFASAVVDPVSGTTSDRFAMSTKTARASLVPDLFTQLPPCRDLHTTESSQVQDETIQEVLPFLSGLESSVKYNSHGVPPLRRDQHIAFLKKSLGRLPPGYVAADASRPWMFYWALTGLATLGEDVSEYEQRVINTIRPIQNPTGGFGGGNGQMSHLAPTYAILLSLAIIGGTEAMEIIDRKSMWKWLSLLKQPDGGFQMSVGGEEDVR